MLVLGYFTEGTVRVWSDSGLSAWLAGVETLLSVVFFFAAIYYAKLSAPSRLAKQGRQGFPHGALEPGSRNMLKPLQPIQSRPS